MYAAADGSEIKKKSDKDMGGEKMSTHCVYVHSLDVDLHNIAPCIGDDPRILEKRQQFALFI